MKENLEHNIKKSLENHEMPYNASAWTAMQAKLDIVKPVTSPVSNMKWYISAASVVAVGIVTYVAFNNSAETTKEVPQQAKNNTELVESTTNSTATENTTESNTTNSSTTSSNTNESTVNGSDGQRTNSTNNSISQSNPFVMTSNGGNGTFGSDTGQSGSNPSNGNTNGGNTSGTLAHDQSKNYTLPNITEVCEGETTTIKNTNDVALMIEGSEMQFVIPAHSERKVRMTKEGTHEIYLMTNDNSKKSNTFFVKRAPKADFIIDTDTKFEKGLPTTKLETSVPGVEYSWIIGKSRIEGEKVNAHFYKTGNEDITLTVKDANGCSNSITKSIRMDDKYNLMAVNSFIPEDIDTRNNTFMPFALTQRNVRFNLIVIDPTAGHTVFQSNDASNAWDGIDKTTGNGVNYGTTYIWKVTIENAEPNENNEYAGNITPIRKR
jgi:hypothetical protein